MVLNIKPQPHPTATVSAVGMHKVHTACLVQSHTTNDNEKTDNVNTANKFTVACVAHGRRLLRGLLWNWSSIVSGLAVTRLVVRYILARRFFLGIVSVRSFALIRPPNFIRFDSGRCRFLVKRQLFRCVFPAFSTVS